MTLNLHNTHNKLKVSLRHNKYPRKVEIRENKGREHNNFGTSTRTTTTTTTSTTSTNYNKKEIINTL